ncbi:MAG: hypothetical protein CFE24_14940 [Flavobacterium sp. BFFFF2]|nr:MAG: hypothetical protein CFE24_14940 [Flavobacterium sp. BFFFF2]
MLTLGQIENSEYNLLGAMSEDDFLQALDLSGPNDKKKLFKKIQTQSRTAAATNGSRSRAEFEKRISMLPKEIQTGLANQSLQAVDTAYYVVKSISGSKVIKMFKDDDNKVVGSSNISSGKLEKGNHFLLYGIHLLGGVGDGTDGPGIVNFDVIPDYVRNGEFEFKANGTVLIPNASCEVFQTEGKDTFKGLFVLDNPKIIRDQQSIEFNIEWAVNAPVNTYLKAILRGTAVIKA